MPPPGVLFTFRRRNFDGLTHGLVTVQASNPFVHLDRVEVCCIHLQRNPAVMAFYDRHAVPPWSCVVGDRAEVPCPPDAYSYSIAFNSAFSFLAVSPR